MAARETLNNTIRINRELRKLKHPALNSAWDFLTRDQQSDELRKWKMQIKRDSHTF